MFGKLLFFFVFPKLGISYKEKKAASQHGLGIKIMEQIITRHGDLMEVERLSDSYRVTVALPLVTPSDSA